MESHEVRSVDREIDRQVLVLLEQYRRLTFLSLADLLPTHNWQALFMALNRLCRQQYVGLMPLKQDYEVVWLASRENRKRMLEEPCLRM